MKQRVVYVYTHDSIGLGEDGPTHQPVEQIPSLRATPNLQVWRPCDAVESAVAWGQALQRADGPTALCFSRQALPHQHREAETLAQVKNGGYVLSDSEGQPELILMATGSEVQLAMEAAKALAGEGRRVRVVSMPCVEAFEAQPAAYREAVLPRAVTRRLAIEAAQGDGWYKYVGLDGAVIGMKSFGESAPADQLFKLFGFTVDNVTAQARALLA